jgi:hypothetical protein
VIGVGELDGRGDDLFKALGFGGVGSELIEDLVYDFEGFVGRVGVEEVVDGFSGADEKVIGVDFEMLADIRWKFHLNYLNLLSAQFYNSFPRIENTRNIKLRYKLNINQINRINKINPKNHFNPINQINPKNHFNPINQINPINHFNPLNPINNLNPHLIGITETGINLKRVYH